MCVITMINNIKKENLNVNYVLKYACGVNSTDHNIDKKERKKERRLKSE